MKCLWRRRTTFVQKVVEGGRISEMNQRVVFLVRPIGLESVKQVMCRGSTRAHLRSICSRPGDLPHADWRYLRKTMVLIVGGKLAMIQEALVNIK
jgi:hypothetical protein